MKKILQNRSFSALAMALFLTTAVTNAQTRTASLSGNWNNTTTWGGASVPTSANDVVINSGITVTVDIVAAACNTVTFASASGTISVGTGNTLAVTGAVTLQNAASGNRAATLTGAGTLTCASVVVGGTTLAPNLTGDGTTTLSSSINSLTVSGNISLRGVDDGNDDNNVTFDLISGSVSVAGTLDLNEDNGSAVSFTLNGGGVETGTLNLAGATPFTITGAPNFNAAGTSATVNYSGGDQAIRTATYTNLTTSTSGTKTIAGNLTITGNLLVDAGSALTMGGNDITIDVNASRSITINGTLNINGNGRLMENQGGTKTLFIGPAGVLNITDNGGSTLPVMNAYSFDAGSTVNYGSTDAQTIENTPVYGNMATSGSGTKTLETAGGTMTFAGSITIGNGTTLASNNKTINLAGDFINNGSFTQGSSTVVLDGSAAQEMGGATATTFNTVTVNNTGTGITVSRDITVTGTFTLTDGIVTTSATPNGLVTLNSGSTLSGGSAGSHINGPIRRAGSTGFTFPVGNGTLYSPVTITAPGEAGDIFQAEYKRASATGLGGITAPGLTQVSNCEYWDLNEIADPGNNNTLSVTVTWFAGSGCGSSYITDYTKLTLAHFSGGSWSDHGGTPSGNNTTGSIIRTGVTSFSPFTLGSTVVDANPLPVSFSDVKAFEKGSGIQVDWTNLTESDINSYVIERSSNGVDFNAIGQQAPRSNQADKASYTYLDAAPLPGTNFYRVKAVELTGKNVFSKMLRVETGNHPKGISLYPNPVSGSELTIGFSAVKGQYNLNVLNTAGQVVYRQLVNHAGGAVSQTLALPSSLKAGVYHLLISGTGFKETKMFIIQ
ncbi:MAG: T9SS type A sorting domain-containing protein [Sphingobacteriales bacterium]|nr:T9SS type A sorting domain-containing protein [Sphingobacteriales bacterium]